MRPISMKLLRLSILLLALSCEEATTPTLSPHRVASIVVTPDGVSIRVGHTLQMSAILKDSMGDTITNRSVTWTSSDTTEAEISTSGLVTAKAPGHLIITASADSVFGSTALTVLVPVLTVRIGPTSAILVPGGSLRLSDTLVGADGSILSDRLVSWSSDDSTVATVTDSGLVTGLRLGIDSIRASSEGTTSYFPTAILVTQPSFVMLSTVLPHTTTAA